MPLNFIELWADRSPARRWPAVYALLLVLILAGCALGDDGYDAAVAQVHAACKRKHGDQADVITIKGGHLVCRRKVGATV